MKTKGKKIIVALMLAMGPMAATAQDTVYGSALPDRYFAPERPDAIAIDTNIADLTLPIACPKCGYIKYTESSLKVYGMAAALATPAEYNGWFPGFLEEQAERILDTSRSALQDEHLLLWEWYGEDSVELVGDVAVAIGSEPPDYYWDMQLTPSVPGAVIIPFPMYERYFPEPITVEDSFFMGKTGTNGRRLGKPDSAGHIYYNWGVNLMGFVLLDSADGHSLYPLGRNFIYYCEAMETEIIQQGDTVIYDTTYISEWRRSYGQGHVVLFPIITPGKPDTTGIGDLAPVDRNTTVSPNPATGMVQVASGYGVQAIEAYDASGSKVFERQCSGGMTATLDVSRWASGTYILRIRTALGTATKKLVVQ